MHHRLFVVILASLSMLGALSIDAYLPALKVIASDFSATGPAVQQTLTVYLVGFAVMMLFCGTLSDSFGRRPVILVSLGCYLLSSVGAALSPTLGCLMFFRLLQGLSGAAGMVLGRSIVGDLYTGADAQRILSYISMVFGIAPALAPILGGWLLIEWGWRSIFYFISFFSLALFAACFFDLPETLVPEKRHAFHFSVIVRNYIDVGAHLGFLMRSISIAASFIGIMLYVAAAPVYLLDLLHVGVKGFGWLFVTFIAGMTLGSACSGYYSHRLKPTVIIRIGYLLMFGAAVVSLVYTALFSPAVPWAVLPHFVYGFGMSFGTPAMTVLTLEMFPHVKGMPSSLQGFIFFTFFAIVSGVVVPLLDGSAFHLALGTAAILGGSWLLWYLGSRGEARHPVLSDEELRLTEESPHL